MKLVILDRNGTINAEGDEYIKSPEEWVPLPGALEAIARLNHAGFHVVVAANLEGLGRGLYDVASLNAIHTRMHKLLATVGGRLDAVFFCPHSPDEACSCRKPQPGLLEQIGERYGVDLAGVPAVGDNADDAQAAAAAGCEPHLVLTGRSAVLRGRPLPPEFPPQTRVHADLAAFVDHLISRGEPLERAPRPVPGA
ncbi:D-glycero-beta-D-manno-heptose 1,7-bisphosphate 7-phosphatase [Ramlibacter sp. 2FC]|uniref:D-glycero-beta-D-manno-heptose 1,7-bisphosphate 7-phosphatase n=1 Tax=Ramlibacter sp. 2FC TaxID=2502188 RepID=UPI0010F635CB